MEAQELAKRLHISLEKQDGSDLTVPCDNLFRGSTYCDRLPIKHPLPDGFLPVDRWSNGYREVYISRDDRAILTYCEGDLDLTVDPDEATWEARLLSAEAFYDRSN